MIHVFGDYGQMNYRSTSALREGIHAFHLSDLPAIRLLTVELSQKTQTLQRTILPPLQRQITNSWVGIKTLIVPVRRQPPWKQIKRITPVGNQSR